MAIRGLQKHRAEALVEQLRIASDTGVCQACLSIVAWTIRTGTPAQVRGSLCSMTPNLWHEGLAEVAFAAVRDAAASGVPDAEVALAELETRGPRSGVARAIVRRLAIELTRDFKAEQALLAQARDRLTMAPPEWN